MVLHLSTISTMAVPLQSAAACKHPKFDWNHFIMLFLFSFSAVTALGFCFWHCMSKQLSLSLETIILQANNSIYQCDYTFSPRNDLGKAREKSKLEEINTFARIYLFENASSPRYIHIHRTHTTSKILSFPAFDMIVFCHCAPMYGCSFSYKQTEKRERGGGESTKILKSVYLSHRFCLELFLLFIVQLFSTHAQRDMYLFLSVVGVAHVCHSIS